MIDIVIGTMFGDEGKGFVVNKLCTDDPDAIVVRFSGGHQCGHNVDLGVTSHIFSNFGSGTLRDCQTIWWKACTVDPVGFSRELDALDNMGYSPRMWIHPACPVTTPFDKIENMNDKSYAQHGTTGTGFGATIKRHEKGKHPIFAHDLRYPDILRDKLVALGKYYGYGHYYSNSKLTKLCDEFIDCAKSVAPFIDVNNQINVLLNRNTHFIFEGNQGILLDREHGFFPHVTRAKTISNAAKPVIDMIRTVEKKINIHFVSRCYTTRHGHGPLPLEDGQFKANNPKETNSNEGHQGRFRMTPLNFDLLTYAINTDRAFREFEAEEHLVFTCMDQIKDSNFQFIENQHLSFSNSKIRKLRNFANVMQIKNLYFNHSSVYTQETFIKSSLYE